MRKKFTNEIYNLVTPTKTNMAMSGKKLRAAIENIFSKNMRATIEAADAKRAQDLHKLEN